MADDAATEAAAEQQSTEKPSRGPSPGSEPKNIVVLSDGTGQEGGLATNTNVYKLFNMLEDRTPRQVVFYDAGLGTGFRRVTGMASGMGISRNIQEGYRFIFDNYQAGDRIFMFGFSRGAATVRSLSSFIHHFGLLPQSRPDLIKAAWKIYRRRNPDKRAQMAKDFIGLNHTMWAEIEVLGCYDTVAALGFPFKTVSSLLDQVPFFRHTFHNFELSRAVNHAYHAVAIDDERKTFHPVLWNPAPNVKQVWFTGMHTDVGGGYREQGLSDVALIWMVDQAVRHGLLIYPEHAQALKPDHEDLMHNSRGRRVTKIYRRKVREWDATRPDKPIVHESVVRRAKSAALRGNPMPYNPWILGVDHDVEPWVFPDPDRTWRTTGLKAEEGE